MLSLSRLLEKTMSSLKFPNFLANLEICFFPLEVKIAFAQSLIFASVSPCLIKKYSYIWRDY